MTAHRYPIRAVSKLTGLSLDTLRAWERRHQAVRPQRGAQGRLYSDGDVRRLALLHDLVGRGFAIGQVARRSNRQLRDLVDRGIAAGGAPAQPEFSGKTGHSELDPIPILIDAVQRFDYAAADRELGRLAIVLTARDVVYRVALPLMHTVGEMWQAGNISIAQEHLASALLRNLLGSLVRLYSPQRPPAHLMYTTPAGEEHEFGILTAAMLAAGAGLGVIYLGPNLPAAEIVAAARRAAPQVLVLGLISSEPSPSKAIDHVARKLPARIELWIGGKRVANRKTITAKRLVVLSDFANYEKHLRRLGGAT